MRHNSSSTHTHYQPHGFLYATVQGRLFNIEVSAPRGGRRALTYTQLSRPTNLLNKVSGWLSSAGLGGATPQKGGSAAVSASAASYAANDTVRIVAGPRPKGDHHLGGAGTSVIATTTDAKHVREAYLFTKSSVLGWAMARGVPERFLFEENVLDVIAEDVARFEGMPIAPVCEIIDADLAK